MKEPNIKEETKNKLKTNNKKISNKLWDFLFI